MGDLLELGSLGEAWYHQPGSSEALLITNSKRRSRSCHERKHFAGTTQRWGLCRRLRMRMRGQMDGVWPGWPRWRDLVLTP
jgi:hypothetical protein